MPRKSSYQTRAGQTVNFRLDEDTALYYRKRAKEDGKTLSEFLRGMLVQGMIAESALDIEQRMRALITEMHAKNGASVHTQIPENVLQSIYTSEFLLTAIVEAKDIQQLYAAQDKATARIKKEREASNA